MNKVTQVDARTFPAAMAIVVAVASTAIAGPPGGGHSAMSPHDPTEAAALSATAYTDSTDYDIRLNVPLWKRHSTERAHTLRASVMYSHRQHDGDVEPLNSGETLPSDLYRAQLGLRYLTISEGRRSIRLGGTLGSSGVDILTGGSSLDASLNASYALPMRQRDSLILMLTYANNRSFANGVPLPGVGYAWRPSDAFEAVLGFPFLRFRLNPSQSTSLVMAGSPGGVKIDVAYEPFTDLRLHAGFDYGMESYRDWEAETDDSLFLAEQRIKVGCEARLTSMLSLGLDVGYAFDRSYFTSDEFFARESDIDSAALDDSAFATLTVKANYW